MTRKFYFTLRWKALKTSRFPAFSASIEAKFSSVKITNLFGEPTYQAN
ncbi:MAG: hypothetical protein AB8G15_14295 [Saprospiraceae bacterium]